MIEFILRARKAKASPNLDLQKLPKEGKMDAVCATIAGALWISGDVRKDSAIHAVMEGGGHGPKTVSFYGAGIKGLFHDELSIARYIKEAVQKMPFLGQNEEIKVRAGITASKKSFERLLWEKSGKQVIVLDKEGRDVRGFNFQKDFVAVLGSAEGLPPKTEEQLRGMKAERVSLGPKQLFAAHCPAILHNEIDRRVQNKSGYSQDAPLP